ncbi:anthranilate synthase component II [Glacieibacterium frigidum]|uniref:Aminodeoxychorismate/anthranilate synthase component II n=1 Tax=Glacieibacterium frigidum TaxID=2593303 RepID=A0A552U7W8_9SPHN|nr:aminodeoxychorismate/anthranilate synthase component II [Glacieibacterium frigidum]TRW14312.1 aminodeoxychorismate/anthranilate synthase component II [Glacieibacterium frigidum]
MILVIDNYDSFTYNLVHYLQELGVAVEVARNDALSVDEALALRPRAVLLSPGPCTPNEAGISLDLIAAAAAARLPVLGVCLGYQAIGQAFGARVVRADTVMHGKTSPIHHDGSGVFAGLPSPYEATRYHSLILDADLPDSLVANARTADGIVMGLHHRDLPLHGVLFHPESIASEHGHALLSNFLALAGIAHTPLAAAA